MKQFVLLICYSIKGNTKTNFFYIDNISHPTADQIKSLILNMLKEELGWEPPNLEKILERAEELMDIQSESDDNEVNEQDILTIVDEKEEIGFEGFQDGN